MTLSDQDVKKQIDHMIAFIEQEAEEKVDEVDAKAEEEFQIEKGRLVQQQRQKIISYYDKKQKNLEQQKRVQQSQMLNAARLQSLKHREDHINSILEEAMEQLNYARKDSQRYQKMLEGLLSQAFYQLLETNVNVQCRMDDKNLVLAAIEVAKKDYESATGKTINPVIMEGKWITGQVSGGVIVSSKSGHIKVVNTLESRLQLVSKQMMPEIREILFGGNPNRRFTD